MSTARSSRRPTLELEVPFQAMAVTKNKPDSSFNAQTFLTKVGEGRTLADHPVGRVILSQGDAADSIFYIHKGKVKLTVVSNRGKEAVVAILGSGEFFGEGCLAGQLKRMVTATAMSTASVASGTDPYRAVPSAPADPEHPD